MKRDTFRIFGMTILVFECLLVFVFAVTSSRMHFNKREGLEAIFIFFGFLLFSTLIAVGLINLHRWAAALASVIGAVGSLVTAAILGISPWQASIVGFPVVVGMLVPLYLTIRDWSSLKAFDSYRLNSIADALRSSDPLRLK